MSTTPEDAFPVVIDDDLPEGFDPDAVGDDDEGDGRG